MVGKVTCLKTQKENGENGAHAAKCLTCDQLSVVVYIHYGAKSIRTMVKKKSNASQMF